LLKRAKKESDEIIRELRGFKTLSDKEQNKKIEEMRKRLKDNISDTSQSYEKSEVHESDIPKDLKVGEPVFVTSLGQKGEVASLPDQKGELQVRVGIMKMKVNIKQLRRTVADKKKTSFSSSKSFVSRSSTITMSKDVRGMNFEDASYAVDKYLDDVALSGLEQVTIIHGKGTGVLKSKLKQYFKNHPHVKQMREGEFGEGGSGVTIITVRK